MTNQADTSSHYNKRFVVNGKALDVSTPCVMGVLNVTPDSFSDGGRFLNPIHALNHIEQMVKDGAAIIDVGGESTRPGAEPVDTKEEINRIVPVLREAIPRFPQTIFSIDTTKYEVAKAALDLGAHLVNDVCGLQKEPRFAELCAAFQAGLIIMHSQGDPKFMQQNPVYEDVVQDVCDFLSNSAETARAAGVKAIITDPGIGFGKTLDHNLKLLAHLGQVKELGYPLLLGASRKSMIGKILNDRPADGRLAGTIASHYHGIINGADILRVHDVREAFDSILIYNAIRSAHTS